MSKDRAVFIIKIFAVAVILSTSSYYWLRAAILHIGAGLRYGCLKAFRAGNKASYKQLRYGSADFSVIDHADNNLANGFFGILIVAVILLLIAN